MIETAEQRVANRYIPQGCKLTWEGKGWTVYEGQTTRSNGTVVHTAIAFIGTARRHDFYYNFRTAEQRAKYVAEWIKNQEERAARKVARKSAPNNFQVGDILYSDWGYEQTNIDFYQVVAKTDHTITLKAIKKNSVHEGDMHGTCTAVADAFINDDRIEKWSGSFRRTVVGNEEYQYVNISSYETAYMWDGKPKFWSSWH